MDSVVRLPSARPSSGSRNPNPEVLLSSSPPGSSPCSTAPLIAEHNPLPCNRSPLRLSHAPPGELEFKSEAQVLLSSSPVGLSAMHSTTSSPEESDPGKAEVGSETAGVENPRVSSGGPAQALAADAVSSGERKPLPASETPDPPSPSPQQPGPVIDTQATSV